MSAHARSRVLLVAAVLFSVVAVHLAATHQQSESERTQARVDVVDHLRLAMVEQETGLRGFAQTGDPSFLEPLRASRRDYVRELAIAERALGPDEAAARPLAEQTATAAAWMRSADAAIAAVEAHGTDAISASQARARKMIMDRFRAANARLDEWVRADRAASLSAARRNVDIGAILFGLLFALVGLALVERRARAEARERREEREYADALQASTDEAEAQSVLERRLEQIRLAGPEADRQELVVRATTLAGPVLANLRNLEAARHLSLTDSLTGLPNARAVQDQLTRLAAAAGRHTAPLAALVIDLDHFKALNDGFGHQAGDDVLAEVGNALRGTMRTSDFAGRWGGEEFLVLLPNTDAIGALALAEKLRLAIADIRVEGVERDITATIGVASIPDHAASGEELVRAADGALYVGKAMGRNRVELYVSSQAVALADEDRLAAVRSTRLLDANAPADLQRLATMAADLADAPSACITLVEQDRQFFAGHHGLSPELAAARQTPIEQSFCRHAVTTGAAVIAADARDHALLAGDGDSLGIRAYAGFPLEVDGQVVGALCAFDTEARAWTPEQLTTLDELAARAQDRLYARAGSGSTTPPPAVGAST